LNNTIVKEPTEEIIGNLTIEIPSVLSTDTSKTLYDLFESMPGLEGVVVLEGGYPLGLIMRNLFFQKMAEQFGFSIYMNRPVTLLFDTSPMIMDYYTEISKVGIAAMNRPKNNLYDFILVSKDDVYIGAVSIRLFLIELSRKSDEKLKILNLQHENLKKANEQEIELRKTVDENNKVIQLKSASVKNLLDHAGQGFLSFGDNYIIEDEYSFECINIIGKKLDDVCYLDLVTELFPAENAAVQKLTLKSYFNSQSEIKDDAYLHLLPRECQIGHQTIRFDYKRIEFFGEKKIMVILTDITEKVVMERHLDEEGRNQRLVVKALTSTDEFKRTIEELYDFFKTDAYYIIQNSTTASDALNEIFRCVHTFKGDFAQFGLHNSSKKLHIIEDNLQLMLNSGGELGKETIKSMVEQIDSARITAEDTMVISNILGEDFLQESKKITISEDNIREIQLSVIRTCGQRQCAEILPSVNKLRFKNIKVLMDQSKDYVEYIAERLSKTVPQFIVTGEDIWIEKDKYSKVFKSMVHLFRNMCDHGIEMSDERLAAGKDEVGTITCHIEEDSYHNIVIKISDDGRGIDAAIIKEKALEKGLLTKEQLDRLSEKEIIQIIFMQGFSTKSDVSTLSGRGVGMTAVKEAIMHMNGHMEMETVFGEGTSYIITIPKI